MIWQGRVSLRTRHLGGHLLRGLFGVSAMYCFFLSYKLLPLSDAIALGLSGPIFLTVLSIPFLWFYCKLIVHRLNDLGWSGWWFLLLGPLLTPLQMWMWVEGHTQQAYDRGHDVVLEFGAYAIFFGGFILMGCRAARRGLTSTAPTRFPIRTPRRPPDAALHFIEL